MAWLETKGHVYRIRFRFQGRKRVLPLRCRSRREADDCLSRFEEQTRLIDRGFIETPPEDVDVGLYIISGGKRNERASKSVTASVTTVATLFDAYLAKSPNGAKEESTLLTEQKHISHLRRLIGENIPLHEVTALTLQNYIDRRLKEPDHYGRSLSSRTVKKELSKLAYVWNRFGVTEEIVSQPAPTTRLIYVKERSKPPFQTRAQIERRIARGKLRNRGTLVVDVPDVT